MKSALFVFWKAQEAGNIYPTSCTLFFYFSLLSMDEVADQILFFKTCNMHVNCQTNPNIFQNIFSILKGQVGE